MIVYIYTRIIQKLVPLLNSPLAYETKCSSKDSKIQHRTMYENFYSKWTTVTRNSEESQKLNAWVNTETEFFTVPR